MNYGPCAYLGKQGLLGGTSFGDQVEKELTKLNEDANFGTVWLRGPDIQLSDAEQEKTCTWSMPKNHSFLSYKIVKENAQDVEFKLQSQCNDNYNTSESADRETRREWLLATDILVLIKTQAQRHLGLRLAAKMR